MDKLKGLIGIIITLIFLFISLQNIDFEKVLVLLTKTDVRFVILASAFYMSSFIFRGLRWKILVRNKKKVSFPDSTSYVIIGWMGNNIFPARAGEFLRAYVSGKKEKMGTGFSLATILVERIFDVFTLLVLLFSLVIFADFPAWVEQIIVYVSALLLIGIAGTFVLVKINGGPLRKIKFFKKKIDSFIEGLKIMDIRNGFFVFLLSAFSWITEALVFYSVGIATGINTTFFIALFALVVVNLGIVIPSSPGYIGTFHFFCILALGVFSIGKDLALGFAILAHLAEYIPVTAAGLILLQREGMSLSNVKKES